MAITSTCKPYFLKMPASWAAQGGTMEPEMEVIAARILRSGGDSAASEDLLRLRLPKTIKAIRRQRLLIITSDILSAEAQIADLCLCVKLSCQDLYVNEGTRFFCGAQSSIGAKAA